MLGLELFAPQSQFMLIQPPACQDLTLFEEKAFYSFIGIIAAGVALGFCCMTCESAIGMDICPPS